ncbi:thioesterase domain-containing protein [candidate division KSB1 bacterium]|nr:thioesterase domain-containing protein [candidate division KSB1 bacterium]
MNDIRKTAQDYLYTHIPITQHLQVTVDAYDGKSIRLSAPLAANINHRDSVFGGSLSSVAILAGWTIIHLTLLEENLSARLVIQKSSMDFLSPVVTDFYTECALPDDTWPRFLAMLRKKGKARITLQSTVYADGNKVGVQEGIYVAVAQR